MDKQHRSMAAVNGFAVLAIAVVGWFVWLFRDLPHVGAGLPQLAIALGVILPLWAVGAVRAHRDQRDRRSKRR
ncbi:hypothetical protein [Demequina rhizosphaerae]|uniref:hypothetical protein n=1 Tax=Demequina rhizosphaerae TaxID=1638985 RepID=UPI000AA926B6|nr:hypothetical protein [Demequina rhizosphaerae]